MRNFLTLWNVFTLFQKIDLGGRRFIRSDPRELREMASPTLPSILQGRAKLRNMASLGHWKWVHTPVYSCPHWGQSSKAATRCTGFDVLCIFCLVLILPLTSHVSLSKALNLSQLSFHDNVKMRTSLLGQVHRLTQSLAGEDIPRVLVFSGWYGCAAVTVCQSCAPSPSSTFVQAHKFTHNTEQLCMCQIHRMHTLVHS